MKSMEAAFSPAAGYRALMAAVIERALGDLKGTGLQTERDLAMAFILGEDCEVWCLELGVDYKALREKAAALSERGSAGRFEKTPQEARKRA